MSKPLARTPCRTCGSRIAGGLGYCNKHYIQFKKYGRTFTKEEMKSHYKVNLNTGRTHFKKGHKTWNTGTRGLVKAWNKGKPLSAETKQKLSEALKGRPAWNKIGNGITAETKLQRDKFRKTMVDLVFARDNYTCQFCDQYSGHLHVDHIKAWADYPELRFELDNCRTLCRGCHYYITFKRKMPLDSQWGLTTMTRERG